MYDTLETPQTPRHKGEKTMINKNCPECNCPLTINFITLYETFNSDELTVKKIEEYKKWLKDVAFPKLREIFGEPKPNMCPHCNAELIYVNEPVKEIRLK